MLTRRQLRDMDKLLLALLIWGMPRPRNALTAFALNLLSFL